MYTIIKKYLFVFATLALAALPTFAFADDSVVCNGVLVTPDTAPFQGVAQVMQKLQPGDSASLLDKNATYSFRMSLTDDFGDDDLGYTYGQKDVFEKITADRQHRWDLTYSTDLYAKDEGRLSTNPDGSFKAAQFIKNDNKLVLSLDNAASDNHLYYSVTGGVHEMIGHATGNPFDGSSQQTWFHRWSGNIRQPVDYNDGSGTKIGGIVGGSLGVQGHQQEGNASFTERASVGTILDSIPGASAAIAEADATAAYKPGFVGVKADAGVGAKAYEGGVEVNPHAGGAITFGKCSELGAEATAYAGKPMNYMEYNLPSIWTNGYDTTVEVYFRRSFGNCN